MATMQTWEVEASFATHNDGVLKFCSNIWWEETTCKT